MYPKIKDLHKKAYLTHHPMHVEGVARSIQASQKKPTRTKKIYNDLKKLKFPTKYDKLAESVISSQHNVANPYAGPSWSSYLDENTWFPDPGTTSGYSGKDERLRDLLRTLKDNYTGKYKLKSKITDDYQNYLHLRNNIEHAKINDRFQILMKNLEKIKVYENYLCLQKINT